MNITCVALCLGQQFQTEPVSSVVFLLVWHSGVYLLWSRSLIYLRGRRSGK